MKTTPTGTVSDQRPQGERGRPWTLPLVLAGALGITAAFIAFRQPPSESAVDGSSQPPAAPRWAPAPSAQTQTASLAIDFGNGIRREFAALPWREGMTVGDIMRAARRVHPGVEFTQEGQGKMAMLSSIDGVANGAAEGRFWLYEVDGRPAEVSFEVQPVAAGERVLWAFKQPE